MESEKRNCQNCKNNFVIDADDFGFYKKIGVPSPTFCPSCRMQRRLAWRNNLSFYSRTCGLCSKNVISLYTADSGITVFCNKCWWSDKWDPLDHGRDYDFSKPFFTQFIALLKETPQLAVVNDDGIASLNCEWTHDCWFAKNCYMVFYSWHIENVMYSTYMVYGSKDVVDCMNIMDKAEFLYECIHCDTSYRLSNAELCISCSESQFLYDCRNCSYSFMCAGLRNEKYCFKNQRYSKEEYEKILAEYKLDTFSGRERAEKEFREFILTVPRRYAFIIQSKSCTGDFILNGKDSKSIFSTQQPENCKWIDGSAKPKDSYDLSTAGEMTECYDSVTIDHSNRNLFGIFSVKSQDLRYTQHCHSSKHLFGCVSLRHNEYSIFNKQYTKEEYEALVPKIIAHMNEMPYVDKNGVAYTYGEFYPSELSLFGYNETSAMEQFPLSKDEAIARSFNWQDNIQKTTGKQTIPRESIPESIDDINESIQNEILECMTCARNYKIMPNEFIFYKKMRLPIPRRCFHCRHKNRIERRTPYKLWNRSCMCKPGNHEHEGKCTNEFETSYAPERPEIIYCEQCYLAEIN